MKALALAFLATTGCFASWSLTQSTGNQRILNESVRSDRIPQPGAREHLRVTMPLAPQFPPRAFTTSSTTTSAVAPTALPFAFECISTQTGSDTVYRSGFRYGSKWKTATAIMFALEAGGAAAILLAGDTGNPNTLIAAGIVGADALGTAALFFIPRKEILREDVESVASTIRSDCPAGLTLHVGDETLAIDAAGRIGDYGEAVLDAWMLSPTASAPRLIYRDRAIELRIGEGEICTWKRTRHQDQSTCPYTWTSQRTIAAVLEVPMGTLTQIE